MSGRSQWKPSSKLLHADGRECSLVEYWSAESVSIERAKAYIIDHDISHVVPAVMVQVDSTKLTCQSTMEVSEELADHDMHIRQSIDQI